ncbi:putative enzyme [Tenacibaculum maritimum]|uniref:Type 1 glutamine amidotransferase-like domain-containing protein n=1 Tax=Tenacibaculum maritimum TaxID=107401 RepID=UPI0012E56A6C|nr:Type 1 glutamine amidotransferase-like domain-containing protein [Tenacibaculum maritimum]CAA0144571.1 putative enzyme [Tenacibaculum maritimum]CAA0218465.1 putative enzyme [Tenacibaculum maritimum]
MIKLFLTSSFVDVQHLFEDFINEKAQGKCVAFIPNASFVEEYKGYVENDKQALKKLGITIDELDISKETLNVITEKIEKNDFIYVSGGNTFYLLQELKKSGADKVISNAVMKGKIYIGASAGSIIMSANIEYVEKMDNKEKGNLANFGALNIVDFYPVPHHTNEPFKKVVENILNEYKEKIKLIPISNTEVIEIKGKEIKISGVK